MLILINIDIVIMVLDLMHAHNFHCQLVNFDVVKSFSVHADERKKDMLVLFEGPIDELDDILITAKANITKSRNKICLSLHYDTN